MSIRKPIKVATFLDSGDVGAGSTAGMKTFTTQVPQDTDNIVLKLTASLVGASVSATLQTTDDGGTTWYDTARSQNATLANNTVAVWLSVPTIGSGVRSTTPATASTTGGVSFASILQTTGSAAASTLTVGQTSGLPIMDTLVRVGLIYTGAVVTNDLTRVDLLANNQSNRA